MEQALAWTFFVLVTLAPDPIAQRVFDLLMHRAPAGLSVAGLLALLAIMARINWPITLVVVVPVLAVVVLVDRAGRRIQRYRRGRRRWSTGSARSATRGDGRPCAPASSPNSSARYPRTP